ncbi:hypothetical protein Acr_07g0013970 [Actinidia rufa]|uniref:Uncharacterized protein n=1 Tax=Actinidia rufa TaxID=165716 RepID=A0A7J0EXJ8_9ERIC|nr:hypothetical protein Acr_07g0013970 [Actinidia rufa]
MARLQGGLGCTGGLGMGCKVGVGQHKGWAARAGAEAVGGGGLLVVGLRKGKAGGWAKQRLHRVVVGLHRKRGQTDCSGGAGSTRLAERGGPGRGLDKAVLRLDYVVLRLDYAAAQGLACTGLNSAGQSGGCTEAWLEEGCTEAGGC